MTLSCKAIGCCNPRLLDKDFCEPCLLRDSDSLLGSLSEQYPDHYKPVGDLVEIDAAAVHQLFNIPDPSGCLQQASAKILMSGVSGQRYRDVKEARDLLTRWLQLNKELLS